MTSPYIAHHSTLTNPRNETGARYQAALQIVHDIEQSSENASLAAKDLKSYIGIIKEGKESTLHQPVFDVLWKLVQLKGHKEDFTNGGLPEFCIQLVKDERFRLKSSAMVFFLLEYSDMVTEMVDIGMVDVLIRYSDSLDKKALSSEPRFLLKTRKFVFQSLRLISKQSSYWKLLLEKKLLESVKKNCFNLSFASSYARQLPDSHLGEIRSDELNLLAAGMDILYNLSEQFQNFGKIYKKVRKEEVKYVYDYDTEDEMSQASKGGDGKNPLQNFRRNTEMKHEQNLERQSTEEILGQLRALSLVDDVLLAVMHTVPDLSLLGLRTLYMISHVLHLFTTEELRVQLVNCMLDIAIRISGHRRFMALTVLRVLATNVENSLVFTSSSVFQTLFFIGMEENGEVLGVLLSLLASLSVNKSTAEEQALRSDCPKLLIKILNDDYNNDIPKHVPDGKETKESDDAKAAPEADPMKMPKNSTTPSAEAEKQAPDSSTVPKDADAEGESEKESENIKPADRSKFAWSGKIPTLCLMTLANLAMNSTETREALVDAGALTVLSKILSSHSEDFIGMNAMMTLAYIHSTEQNNLMPACTLTLLELLFECLEYSLAGKSFYNYVFTVEELCLALRGLSLSRTNGDKVIRGLPIFLNILSIFVEEYGVKEEERVSKVAVGHILHMLHGLSTHKRFLIAFVEIGEGLPVLLKSLKDLVAEADDAAMSEVESESTLIINSVLFAIEDELCLTKEREEAKAHLRKSSRIRWSRLQTHATDLKNFIKLDRFDLDV